LRGDKEILLLRRGPTGVGIRRVGPSTDCMPVESVRTVISCCSEGDKARDEIGDNGEHTFL